MAQSRLMGLLVLLLSATLINICQVLAQSNAEQRKAVEEKKPSPKGRYVDPVAASLKESANKDATRKAAFKDLNEQLLVCLRQSAAQHPKISEVKLVLRYNRDGNLGYTGLMNPQNSEPDYVTAAALAVDAAKRCQPVRFTDENYEILKSIVFTFQLDSPAPASK